MKTFRMMTVGMALGAFALLVPERVAAAEVSDPDPEETAVSVVSNLDFECVECRAHDNGDGTWDIVFGGLCDGGGASFASTDLREGGGEWDSCVECEMQGGESCQWEWGQFPGDGCNELDCSDTANEASENLLRALDRADFRAVTRIASSSPGVVRWDPRQDRLQTLTCSGAVWSNIPVSTEMAVHLEAAFE